MSVIFFIILFHFLCVGLVVYPYARALRRGIAAARDPELRVTPRGSWFHFDRIVDPMMNNWWLNWVTPPILLTIFMMFLPDSGQWEIWFGLLGCFLDHAALANVICLYQAPRSNENWKLAGTAILAALFLLLTPGFLAIFALRVFPPLLRHRYDSVFNDLLALLMLGYATLPIGCYCWHGFMQRHIRRGERWFRFEE